MLILLICSISVSNHLYATKYYVSKSGDNSNGSSWVNAFTNLQSALSVVSAGDTVIVAKGSYTPSTSDKTIAFSMVAGVKILGGFVGNETINQEVIDNCDFITNETILSGDLAENDGSGYITDNSYSVVIFDAWNTAMSNTTILDGFTISGGYSAGSSLESANGGGIYMQMGANKDCNPLLRNLIIKNNRARSGGGIYMDGLIDSYAQISPTIENVVFDSNYAYYTSGCGGGIYMAAGPNASINPILKGVAFANNTANASGGGIFFLGGYAGEPGIVSSTISNATFYNNSCGSNNGNAIFVHGEDGTASPVFNNTIFFGNPESQIFKTALSGTANPSFNHCLITGSPSSAWNSDIGTDMGNNIEADPLFADPENGNISVLVGSPVLNTGDNAYGINIGYYQGSGITIPIVTIVGVLSNFGTIDVGTASAEQYFTISGINLINAITIEAPTGYEISLTSGAGFFGQLYLFPLYGSVETTTIYVRFKPTVNGIHNGNISVKSPGMNEQLIAVNGYAGSSPEISVIDNKSVCNGDRSNISFSVTDDNPSTLSFGVSISNETVLPLSNANITGSEGTYILSVEPVSAGVTDITISVTDADENISTQSFQLTVLNGPTIEIAFTQRICNGDPAEINITSTGGTGSVTYKLNDGVFSAETIYSYLADGNYVVVAMDESGCTDTSNVYTVSNPEYITGTADVTKEITCRDDNDAEITASPAGGWGGFEFSLNNIEYQKNNIFTNLGPGDYSIYVRDQEGCTQLLFSTNIINPDQLAIDYVTISDINQSQNKELNIVAYGGRQPYTYSMNGSQFQSESFFTDIPAGTYTAYVKDNGGCIATKEVVVETTGISNIEAFNINIYPIPTKDFIYFNQKKQKATIEKIELFDMSGNKVKTFENNEISSNSINIQGINQGVYILKFIFINENSGYKKIIIK